MTSANFTDALRAKVSSLLLDNGYTELRGVVVVGEVQLEVESLWEGPPTSLDLTIVTERPTTREETLKLYWLVQRLARALDSAESRRTVSVVLIGEPTGERGASDLLELARVLIVDGSLPTERMLGPLLTLRLPDTASAQFDGLAEVTQSLGMKRSEGELARLIQAASAGASVVSDRYRAWIDESFVGSVGIDG